MEIGLVVCTSSDDVLNLYYSYKFVWWKYLKRFESSWADTISILIITKGHNSVNIYIKFLFPAHCLIMLCICIRFLENILNNFRVMERTWFCDGQSSKGNNSKSIKARVINLALCMSSNVDWNLYEVLWSLLKPFSSYRADMILWLTDRCWGKKQNVPPHPPPPSPITGERHNTIKSFL